MNKYCRLSAIALALLATLAATFSVPVHADEATTDTVVAPTTVPVPANPAGEVTGYAGWNHYLPAKNAVISRVSGNAAATVRITGDMRFDKYSVSETRYRSWVILGRNVPDAKGVDTFVPFPGRVWHQMVAVPHATQSGAMMMAYDAVLGNLPDGKCMVFVRSSYGGGSFDHYQPFSLMTVAPPS